MARCVQLDAEIMDVVKLAQQLIRINSIPGCAHSEGVTGETRLANWLEEYFDKFNIQTNLLPVVDNRPNLIARHRQFNPGLPTLAFEAHLDTVSVEGMSIDPFAAEIHNGRLYGRGACDVKGTMAVMITAMLHWFREHPFDPGAFNLIFMATMGEEGGTLGARELSRRPIPLNMVLIGEPTGMQPVIGHFGSWRFTVKTTGKSCHSSRPYMGVNAIERMRPALDLIMQELKPGFERIAGNSMSMTKIHGGELINIIPNFCELSVDCRFKPETDIAAQRDLVAARLNALKGVSYNEIAIFPPYSAKADSQILPLLEQALDRHNLTHVRKFEPWYSDAGHFSGAGYDTVLWGVGDMAQAHSENEFIEITQLLKGVEVLTGLLQNCAAFYSAKPLA